MLKANVGLSRKISENYNSTGFSLNLEGEIHATLDDPEAVIERIKNSTTWPRKPWTSRSTAPVRLRHRLPGRRPSARQQRPLQRRPLPRPTVLRRPERPSERQAARTASPPPTSRCSSSRPWPSDRSSSGPKLEGFIEETIGRAAPPTT